MKILCEDELKTAEQALRSYLPKSSKVYGFLYAMNRNKPSTLEVVVDAWPDFKTILLRPDQRNVRVSDYMKKVTLFCKDDEVLRRMIVEENAIDWSTYFLIGGFDISHAPMLQDIVASRGVNVRGFTLVHLMTLSDPCNLPELSYNSIESRICSLNESHIDLVNRTWKFGGDEKGYKCIKNQISNFPTCCIVDETGQPVSWVLMYDYCAHCVVHITRAQRQRLCKDTPTYQIKFMLRDILFTVS